jgi:hypothetical protein
VCEYHRGCKYRHRKNVSYHHGIILRRSQSGKQ